MRVNGVPFVEIEPGDWSLDSGRYIASINVAGLLMHVEAFPVSEANHTQVFPEEWDEALNAVYHAMGADGAWETTQVKGRECVIVATPFCN